MRLLKIHLIEDNNADADLIKYHLQKSSWVDFTIERSTTLTAAINALANPEPIDLILLDLNLPDSDHQDTLNKINHFVHKAPVIVLTSLDLEKGFQAIQHGAQDFIKKESNELHYIDYKILFAIERNGYLSHLVNAAFLNQQTGMYTLKYLKHLFYEKTKCSVPKLFLLNTKFCKDNLTDPTHFAEELKSNLKLMESRLNIYLGSDDADEYIFLIEESEHLSAYLFNEIQRYFRNYCQDQAIADLRYGIGIQTYHDNATFDELHEAARFHLQYLSAAEEIV